AGNAHLHRDRSPKDVTVWEAHLAGRGPGCILERTSDAVNPKARCRTGTHRPVFLACRPMRSSYPSSRPAAEESDEHDHAKVASSRGAVTGRDRRVGNRCGCSKP